MTTMRWGAIPLLVLSLLALPAPAEAQTGGGLPPDAVFVATDGDDGDDGTAARPLATVAAALERAPEGGTVVLRGGTHRAGGLVATRPVTVRAHPGEEVWLKGSEVVAAFQPDGDDWRAEDPTTRFSPATVAASSCRPDKCLDEEFPLADRREMVFVDGEAQRQVGTRDEVAAGTFFVGPDGALVVGTDPAGRTVEVAAHDRALQVNRTAAGTVVRGLRIAHYALDAVNVLAAGVRIEDNTFAWQSVKGLTLSGAADAVVRGNTFTDNGMAGMSAWASDRLLFQDNVFLRNNAEHFATTWSAAGAKVAFSVGVRAVGNRFEDHDATCLWFDVGANDATMVGNVARDCVIGLFFEISRDAVIAGNVAAQNKAGVQISLSTDAQVWNNTLVGNNVNMSITQGPREFDAEEAERRTLSTSTRGTVVRNNLLSAPESFALRARQQPCAAPSMVAAVDTNGYHRAAPGEPGDLIGWADGGRCNEEHASVASFRSSTGHERNGIELPEAEPLFVDAAAGDYQLVADTPARGAGAPLPAEVAAALGVEAGVPVDLGALSPPTGGPTPTPTPSPSPSPSVSPAPSPEPSPSVGPTPPVPPGPPVEPPLDGRGIGAWLRRMLAALLDLIGGGAATG